MKKIILSAFTIVILGGISQAQNITGKKDAKHPGEQLFTRQLNLTDAQKNQLEAIKRQQKEELSTLNKNDNMLVKDWKAQKKEIHQKYKAEFQDILTPQQKEQLAKSKAERHKTGHYSKGLSNRLADLNLSDAQRTKVNELRKDTKSKIGAIRNNSSLSEDQKKVQIKALRKDQKLQMRSILTPGQLQKLQLIRKEKRNKKTK